MSIVASAKGIVRGGLDDEDDPCESILMKEVYVSFIVCTQKGEGSRNDDARPDSTLCAT